MDDDPGTSRKWTIFYSTQPKGRWLTSYGLNLIPVEDDEYFLDPNGDSTYTIKEASDSGLDFDPAPSVFFTYVTPGNLAKHSSLNFSTGLGFDLENPIAFAGAGVIVGDNWNLNLGVVLHEQQRLRGRYRAEEDRVVQELLDDDQLYESTYDVNWFFGFSYRFDKNPFPVAVPPSATPTSTPTATQTRTSAPAAASAPTQTYTPSPTAQGMVPDS
jgi:hypothetical protein